MKFTFDTEKFGSKTKEMAEQAKINAVTLVEKRKAGKEAKFTSNMVDDLDYLNLVADWNVSRLKEDKPFYLPAGLDKESEGMLKAIVAQKWTV